MNMQEKKATMLSMISNWRFSGKSKKTYCAENGINEVTFYYWFSRSKEKDGASGSFTPIDRSVRREIEMIYPNGVVLKLESDLGLLSQRFVLTNMFSLGSSTINSIGII
ncbi:IS66 family insertion sequence element accessory protein TnpA [Sphingobacterium sp. UBA5996]|uniref:IS66 family insertion sequence element accessory protein TnpA n=1 Tax=Sphingobacterium sp. UBA5996 TaxID=1947505 RepID=UPI0025F4DE12|nr:IS66 family insertion sequence element accessory protein TnpB [Sphingobacterium sp. UBA5996]